MIDIYCTNEIYKLNRFYLNFLLNKYNFIKLTIIENENSLFKINYLENNINISVNNLNENILKILTKINKNFYLLNIHILSENENLIYLNNYDIKIIDKSFLNINILKKYKEILYLPYQINHKFIFNHKKIYDIAILNKKSIYVKNICNLINKEITDLSSINNEINMYETLFKHKILLLFNVQNNLLNDFLYQYCIYNNVLIINDKNSYIYQDFLKNYVIDMQYNLIPNFVIYVLNNYSEIYHHIYHSFNLKYIENNTKDISDKTINKITEKNENNNDDNNDFGFIILRHVNSETTSQYWIESYNCIRRYYNNKIIIIDDNSNYDFINNIHLINCEIIKSEFFGRGEILPYYYLYKHKFFKKCVIIHDSVFINKYIDFNNVQTVRFIWHFTHHWDNENDEIELLNNLDNVKDIEEFYYEKDKWYGCFGLQTVIDYSFLEKIVIKYNLFKLIDYITTREIRMNFERIFGLICFYENTNLFENVSLYGIIHHYIHWGYTYNSYIEDKKNDKLNHLDIIKVWSGR